MPFNFIEKIQWFKLHTALGNLLGHDAGDFNNMYAGCLPRN